MFLVGLSCYLQYATLPSFHRNPDRRSADGAQKAATFCWKTRWIKQGVRDPACGAAWFLPAVWCQESAQRWECRIEERWGSGATRDLDRHQAYLLADSGARRNETVVELTKMTPIKSVPFCRKLNITLSASVKAPRSMTSAKTGAM